MAGPFPDPALQPGPGLYPGGSAESGDAPLPLPQDPTVTPGETVKSFGDHLYDELSISQPGDDQRGWPLLLMLRAIGVAFGWLHDIVRDSDAGPGWSRALDPNRARPEILPWLGQFAGVRITAGLTEAQARARITSPPAFDRGTADGVKAAMRQTLTGTRYLFFLEAAGSPYRVVAVTRIDETPNPAATLAAGQEWMPAGLILTLTVTGGRTWLELRSEQPTWAAVIGAHGTWANVRGY